MANLSTDLNVSPYYDDYDENKQYYRILFRPGTAVQARELTQIQTLLQNQISRFGSTIFSDGARIEGCGFARYPNLEQVKFKDSDSTTIDFGILTANFSSIANSYLLVSNTTGLRASIFRAHAGAESAVNAGSLETNRAYLLYGATGNSAGVQATRFNVSTSEQIDVYTSLQDKDGPLVGSNRVGVIYTLASNGTVNGHGVGYGLSLSEGLIYQKGFFQKVLPINFVIKEESSNASGIRVGFDTLEYIVKPAEDASLYDNSIGSPNYSAPGAHRLKLVPTPVFYDVSNTQVEVPKNFLPILEFDGGNGNPVVDNIDPQLAALGDLINKRTFEESGDYVVKPFQVDVSAHESNTQSFYYNVSPGIGYVDGNRVEFESTRKIEVSRAIDKSSANNGAITTNLGNYLLVRDLAGTFDIDTLQEISFYSANQQILSNNQSMSTPLGVAVGNANVRGILHYSDTKGTANATYLVYVYNVRMRSGLGTVPQFYANAKSIYASGTYGAIFGDIVANTVDGKINLQEQENRLLVYPVGYPGVNRLTNGSGVNATTVVYRKTLTGTLVQNAAASGIKSYAQFTMPSPDLCYYGAGTLSSALEDDINITFAQDTLSANVINNGAISYGAGAGTCTISSVTSFNGATPVGSGIAITGTGGTTYHTVVSLVGSNQVVLTPNSAVTGTIQMRKFFKRGTHINLSASATNNTAVVSSDRSTLTINMDMWPDLTSYNLNAQIPISRTTAQPIPKVVRKNTHVGINCSTAINTTTGPWDLGWSDVYKIANVHVGSTFSVANPDRIDWFELDNGQQDNMYGHAKLRLKPQYNGVLTAASRILVKMHHFTPNVSSTAALFFSKDSYPIDDANTANNNAIATAEIPVYKTDKDIYYDLRNCIDFRPVLANTAILGTVGTYTTNPANGTASFVTVSGAPMSFDPDSNMTYNIEYYLPRKDILLINKDRSLSVKKGEPALDPKLPIINKAGLKIAEITVPPYPSLTFKEAE